MSDEVQVGSDLNVEIADVACTSVVGAESQTTSDFMDEWKRIKDELALFKQANQDLCSKVADLRQNCDRLSLAANFLKSTCRKTEVPYR